MVAAEGKDAKMGDAATADAPVLKKVKADDDPVVEGEWMRLADLRYKIARCANVFQNIDGVYLRGMCALQIVL